MIELISIHIPKTGGTSFYRILQEVYGQAVSPSLRRRDLRDTSDIRQLLQPDTRVLHGHFRYPEVRNIQRKDGAKVIAWLRDPAERVYSNYRFFIAGLHDPARNPQQYALNKHRIHESLDEYAARPENRNRMCEFLEGLAPEKLFFCGLLEHFSEDLQRLADRLDWPPIAIPTLNRQAPAPLPAAQRKRLLDLNRADQQLYDRARQLRELLP